MLASTADVSTDLFTRIGFSDADLAAYLHAGLHNRSRGARPLFDRALHSHLYERKGSQRTGNQSAVTALTRAMNPAKSEVPSAANFPQSTKSVITALLCSAAHEINNLDYVANAIARMDGPSQDFLDVVPDHCKAALEHIFSIEARKADSYQVALRHAAHQFSLRHQLDPSKFTFEPLDADPHMFGLRPALMRVPEVGDFFVKFTCGKLHNMYFRLISLLATELGLEHEEPLFDLYGDLHCRKFIAENPEERSETLCFNAGIILFGLYILRCRDCHSDNMIVSRGWPVLIDGDCIIDADVPIFKDIGGHTQMAEAGKPFNVLMTHFVPFWRRNGVGRFSDLSGVGGSCQISGDRREVGSEQEFVGQTFSREAETSFIEGFRAAAQVFLKRRTWFREFLGDCCQGHLRFVHRSTSLYVRTMACAIVESRGNPRVLGLALERLYLPYLRSRVNPKAVIGLVDSEIEQLSLLDVPYFRIDAEQGQLRGPGSSEAVLHAVRSPRSGLLRWVDAINDADVDRQIELVRYAFEWRYRRGVDSGSYDEYLKGVYALCD